MLPPSFSEMPAEERQAWLESQRQQKHADQQKNRTRFQRTVEIVARVGALVIVAGVVVGGVYFAWWLVKN